MRVYLVQHGEAVTKEQDPDRPLSAAGVSDVQKVAGFLSKFEHGVERIVHSGKLRAEQTADILAKELVPMTECAAISGINPNASVEEFESALLRFTADTMIVGHLPFMAKLVSYLLTGKAGSETVAYQPGSVVCLERAAGEHWHLLWMLRPELLRR